MSDPNELKRTLMFARDLADPDWSLSVPKPAKDTIRKLLAIIEANKPRTITTAEEMDRLRFQAVVLDAYGTPYVCERHRTDGTRNEWKPSGMSHLDDSETILYHGPVTVIHEGEDRP